MQSWSRFLLVVFLTCAGIHAQVKMKDWSPAYVGIDQASGSINAKYVSVVYAMRVDLKAPGISFITTPHAGSRATVSDTVSDFVEKTHTQVAINAGFFSPCCLEHAEDKDILGLTVSEGKVISPPSTKDEYNAALLITRQNESSITTVSPASDLSNVFTAVTGSAIIVQKGENTGDVNQLNKAAYANPRTAVGVSKDGRYLYLVVIDGRKPGYSMGTTNHETAEVMLALGAYTALNLDGGGSTTMVKSDEQGHAVTVNHPSGGAERFDASALGVHADFLPH
jgi:exopolysaccharide biosynthesis protein